VIADRERRLVAYLRPAPRTLAEIAGHRFVYRPEDPVPFAEPVEARSMSQHLRATGGGARSGVEPGRYLAVWKSASPAAPQPMKPGMFGATPGLRSGRRSAGDLRPSPRAAALRRPAPLLVRDVWWRDLALRRDRRAQRIRRTRVQLDRSRDGPSALVPDGDPLCAGPQHGAAWAFAVALFVPSFLTARGRTT
jgi:hypothetical protein